MRIRSLGYPRIGRDRELKKYIEEYWSGRSEASTLVESAWNLCASRWQRQHDLGVESIPLGDFSLYDHVLDHALLFGILPPRFQLAQSDWVRFYFSMARGERDAKPFALRKWFNTNYHYLVPEFTPEARLELRWDRLQIELDLAKKKGLRFHPVFIGPWTLIRLCDLKNISPTKAMERLLPLYEELLAGLVKQGFTEIQLDEPALVLDLLREDVRKIRKLYDTLSKTGAKITLATYFESPDPWLTEISNFPVETVHFDLVCGKGILDWLRTRVFPKEKQLSLGVVSGRNIWATPLLELRDALLPVVQMYDSDKLWLAPSCSLVHIPIDRTLERQWDPEFANWVSFADQRLEELSFLKRALSGDRAVDILLKQRQTALGVRSMSQRVHRPEVKQAAARLDSKTFNRNLNRDKRRTEQQKVFGLPIFPVTTIGSFPQTDEVREMRGEWKRGRLTEDQYKRALQVEVESAIRIQEQAGVDILVHGEFERPDMVEYFAEGLDGFALSSNGWVQSYGSRFTKPPLLFGDVRRKGPISIEWYKYAQGLTSKPVKGILTGPLTMLAWSFVREDVPRDKIALQIALALREEIRDLEQAGAKVLQIDEAAFREGLPLKNVQKTSYLRWAIDAFRACSSQAQDRTQIHVHMCYSIFEDIWESIEKLDADVLLLEWTRSQGDWLKVLDKREYRGQIGVGVYDVHSPHVPTTEAIEKVLHHLVEHIVPNQLWVVPDCGLKTRTPTQVEAVLQALVEASRKLRQEYEVIDEPPRPTVPASARGGSRSVNRSAPRIRD